MLKSLLCVVVASLMADGCLTTPKPPPYIPQVNTYYPDHEEILDQSFVQWMPIQEIRCTKTNDGLSKFEARAKNVTTSSIRAKYRVDWMRKDGTVVNAESSWEKLTLNAGQSSELKSIAPNKKCEGYRLSMKLIELQEIQEVNNEF